MTVQQLMKILADCDPEADVADQHGDDIIEVDFESDEGIVYLNI